MDECVSIAWKWLNLLRSLRLQLRGKPGQFRMWQSDVKMVQPVVWLVQQGERYQPTLPAECDDAAGGAVDRIACEADVFDVFAPALEISRDERGHQIHPQEIGPELRIRDY